MGLARLLWLRGRGFEDWSRIADALAWLTEGLDFADALHLLASSHCTEFMSFDDRQFARRAKRLSVAPAVVVPAK
ncbi:hypothetical protein JKG47_19545 [Acidithiobacillus sp. MC6.1]|nr:hypothetical protein [Acidithiobacillus sp. MC6.1]